MDSPAERITAIYHSLIHSPLDVRPLAHIPDIGVIYRLPLKDKFPDINQVCVPEALITATSNQKHRQEFAFFMKVNGRQLRTPNLGQASSAFLACMPITETPNLHQHILDYVAEEPGPQAETDPNTHNYMRAFTDNYRDSRLKTGADCQLVLSGHLAPLIISTADVCQILLLDCLRGKDAYDKAHPNLQHVINVLWGNRIMPITANGYRVLPSTHPQFY